MIKETILSNCQNYKVLVGCMTFNHSKYIENALNGFVMQKTNFPFVCLVIDDCSTDGEQNVIKAYLNRECKIEDAKHYDNENANIIVVPHQKNINCTIVVYFLKENHYSKKKSKLPYLEPWLNKCKYRAICEGDDYWIDPLKLQKQVEFMESHPDCTMTCSRAKLYSEKQQKYIGERYCYNQSQYVDPKEIIERGGLYINTCSIIYRIEIKDNYPDYCKQCVVGDYPLQIMCAMKGRVYYFDEAMSVYRIENTSSWMGMGNLKTDKDPEWLPNRIRSEENMLKGFAVDYPKYSKILSEKINHLICSHYPKRSQSKEVKERYVSAFRNEISEFSFSWKIILFLMKYNVSGSFFRFFPFIKAYWTHGVKYK